jgi:hypothetical protein
MPADGVGVVDGWDPAIGRLVHSTAVTQGDRDLTDLSDPQPPIETPAQFSQRLV